MIAGVLRPKIITRGGADTVIQRKVKKLRSAQTSQLIRFMKSKERERAVPGRQRMDFTSLTSTEDFVFFFGGGGGGGPSSAVFDSFFFSKDSDSSASQKQHSPGWAAREANKRALSLPNIFCEERTHPRSCCVPQPFGETSVLLVSVCPVSALPHFVPGMLKSEEEEKKTKKTKKKRLKLHKAHAHTNKLKDKYSHAYSQRTRTIPYT